MTDFLYPFIEGDEHDVAGLTADLARSAEQQAAVSGALRTATLAACRNVVEQVAVAMADRFARGGQLLVCGNGGSATDAAITASLFRTPPWGRALSARSLTDDPAVLTAVSNDVGFSLVFSRQVIAHGRSGDMAMAISTSGSSENLLTAMAEARGRGMLTVGVAGYDGGRLADPDAVDHCIVVRSDSVHRVQEAQSAVIAELWVQVQTRLGERRLNGS